MYTLKRDGNTILQTTTDFKLLEYIHKKHSFSLSHACKYEGYTIEKDGQDITKDYK